MIFVYPRGPFPLKKVTSLLELTEASPVHAIPVVVQGTIIGRGIPGYILSKDFVLRDETGFVFLDYEQPLILFSFFFGLLRSGKYQGQEVTVEGWYRRAPMPYIEIRRMRAADGTESRCYSRPASIVFWALVMTATSPLWPYFFALIR